MPKLIITLPGPREVVHELTDHVVTVGRTKDNKIQIDDRSVSAHHAKFILANGQYRIRDLESTNKTFVKGVPISETVLVGQLPIRFGNVECLFEDRPADNRLDEFQRKLSELQAKIAELKKSNARLEEEKNGFAERYKVESKRAEALASQAAVAVQTEEQLKAIIADTKKRLEKVSSEQDRLKSDRQEALEELAKVKADFARVQRERDAAAAKAESISGASSASTSKLEDELAAGLGEIARLKDRAAAADLDLNKLVERLADAESEHAKVVAERDEARRKLATLREKASSDEGQLASELAAANSEVDRARKEAQAAREEKAEAVARAAALENDLRAMGARSVDALADAKAAADRAREENAALAAKLTAAENAAKEAGGKLAEATAAAVAAQKIADAVPALEQQLAAARAEASGAKKAAEEAAAKAAAAEAELAKQKAAAGTAERSLAELSARFEKAIASADAFRTKAADAEEALRAAETRAAAAEEAFQKTLDAALREAAEAKKTAAETKHALELAERVAEAAKNEAAAARREASEAREQAAQALKGRALIEESLAEVRSTVEGALAAKATAEKEAFQWREQLDRLRKEVAEDSGEVFSLRAECDQAKRRLGELESEVESRRNEAAAAIRQLAVAQAKLEVALEAARDGRAAQDRIRALEEELAQAKAAKDEVEDQLRAEIERVGDLQTRIAQLGSAPKPAGPAPAPQIGMPVIEMPKIAMPKPRPAPPAAPAEPVAARSVHRPPSSRLVPFKLAEGNPAVAAPITAQPPAKAVAPVAVPGDEGIYTFASEEIAKMRDVLANLIRRPGDSKLLAAIQSHAVVLSTRCDGVPAMASFQRLVSAIGALGADLGRSPDRVSSGPLRSISQAIDVLSLLVEPKKRAKAAMLPAATAFAVESSIESQKDIAAAMDAVGMPLSITDKPQTALSLLEAKTYDFILIAVDLPEMGGVELCSRVRLLPGYRKIPILLITDAPSVGSWAQWSLNGASDFVTRPLSPLEFTVKALAWTLRGQITAK